MTCQESMHLINTIIEPIYWLHLWMKLTYQFLSTLVFIGSLVVKCLNLHWKSVILLNWSRLAHGSLLNQKKTINDEQVWFFKRHSQRHLYNKEATFSDTKDIISWLHTISESFSHLISQNASYLMWKTEIRIRPPK